MQRREFKSEYSAMCVMFREDWKKFKEFEQQEAESDDACDK